MDNLQPKIEYALDGILSRDPGLAKEIAALRTSDVTAAAAESLAAEFRGLADDSTALAQAARRYRVARPVLTVTRKHLDGMQRDTETLTWKDRIEAAGDKVFAAVDAVGRIEVKGNGDVRVAGTGFMIRPGVVATNQHVAAQFAEKKTDGGGFWFRLNLGGQEMSAAIDFLEEKGVPESLEFHVLEVLHMEMDLIPDVAFLSVEATSGQTPLPAPLAFFTGEVKEGQWIAAVGYPERDTREKHAQAMDAIFGDVYDKKRVSPGQVRGVDPDGRVVHDCSVLRGNSGSPLIDLETGMVVGIHSVGEFLDDNFAVSAASAEAILAGVEAAMPAAVRGTASPRDAAASAAAASSTDTGLGEMAVPSAAPTRGRARRQRSGTHPSRASQAT